MFLLPRIITLNCGNTILNKETGPFSDTGDILGESWQYLHAETPALPVSTNPDDPSHASKIKLLNCLVSPSVVYFLE